MTILREYEIRPNIAMYSRFNDITHKVFEKEPEKNERNIVVWLQKIDMFYFRELRALLKKCASTSMCSKLIAYNKDFFSDMVVDAVMCLDSLLPLNMIGKCSHSLSFRPFLFTRSILYFLFLADLFCIF